MDDLEGVLFEDVSCDFCGSHEAQPLFSGPDRLLGLPGEFAVVRCKRCGLLRQNPRPMAETIDFYYPSAYEPYSAAIDDEPSRLRRWDRRYGMAKRWRAIERYQRGGHLLDVGCATGNFLHEMARRGIWEVEGVEPSAKAIAYARDRFGLTIHQGRLTEVDLPDAAFDVVTMWNVLEHLHHPLANLQVVQRILRPGGLFVFSIPNLEGLGVRWFGRSWMGWELPRHLYYFPRAVLESRLPDLGLRPFHWDCLVGAYPSFLLTLRFALPALACGAAWEGWVQKGMSSMFMRLVMAPLFWGLTHLNQASLITVFVRKESD